MAIETTPNTATPTQPPVLWDYARAQRRRIAIGCAIGILIGVTISFFRHGTFSSSATLIFPSTPLSSLAAIDGMGKSQTPSIPLLNGALTIPQLDNNPDTVMMVLQSWTVQERVITEMDFGRIWDVDDQIALHERFSDQMYLRQGKDTGELIVKFTDQSPERACQVVNCLLTAMKARIEELGLDTARQNVKFLESQASLATADLQIAATKLSIYEASHRIVDIPTQMKAMAEQYAELERNVQTTSIEAQLAMRRAEMISSEAKALIRACIVPPSKDDLGSQPVSSLNLNSLYQRVVQRQSELFQLRDKFTSESHEVGEAQKALKEAQRLLRAEMDRQLSLVKTGISPQVAESLGVAALKQAESTALTAAHRRLLQQLDKIPNQKLDYARLSLEVEVQTAKIKLLREELEKARILAQGRGPSFVIVEPARVDKKPNPRRRLIILLACLMFCGGLAAFPTYRAWAKDMAQFEAALLSNASAGNAPPAG